MILTCIEIDNITVVVNALGEKTGEIKVNTPYPAKGEKVKVRFNDPVLGYLLEGYPDNLYYAHKCFAHIEKKKETKYLTKEELV